MKNIPYNPFNRSLEDLETKELAVLKNVAEGWYIEYKRERPKTRSIAKSVAAFANHYGGWIFYGVKETDDGTNRADSYPGLDQQEVSLLVEGIRNAAKDAISPSPYYEYNILNGPCTEINLPNNRAIVVVAVPSGPDTPYIHTDGKIYRRVADSSDPKPENDRFTLDHLWQRGQRAREQVTAFLEREPILSEGESETSFVDIFLLPDPLGTSAQQSELSFEKFVELMSDPNKPEINFTCDNFYVTSGGIVGRQIGTHDPYNLNLTWKHYHNGFSIVSLPFSSARADVIEYKQWLHGYKQEVAMLEALRSGQHRHSFVIDVNQLVLLVLAVFGRQRQFMKVGKIGGPLYAKASLHNVWRRIPFIDTEPYIRFVSECGVPVIQFNDEYAPPGKTFDSLKLIPDDEIPGVSDLVRDAYRLITPIFNALGLPKDVALGSTDDDEDSLWAAAQRAPDVNKGRWESETASEWQ